MAQSGTVKAGISAVLASQYNNLRDDVLSTTYGHQHMGTTDAGRQIPTGGIADHAVTQVKCEYGVPVFANHQGYDDEWWNLGGTANFSITAPMLIQGGAIRGTIPIMQYARWGTVAFGTPYPANHRPVVIVSARSSYTTSILYGACDAEASAEDNTSFYWKVSRGYGMPTTWDLVIDLQWIAFGPGA